MDLKTQITTFFNDVKDIAKIVAPVMAFVGIIGAGVSPVPAGESDRNRPESGHPHLVDKV